MPMQEEPIVGAQYEGADGLAFEVTDFDVDEGIIGIRHADDTVSEIDIDTWYELELRRRKTDDDAEDDEDDYDDNEEEQ